MLLHMFTSKSISLSELPAEAAEKATAIEEATARFGCRSDVRLCGWIHNPLIALVHVVSELERPRGLEADLVSFK